MPITIIVNVVILMIGLAGQCKNGSISGSI